MNKLKSILLARILAVALCLLALVAYPVFSPNPTKAQLEGGCTCYYAGLPYSEGACRGGQRCFCNGSDGVWRDDSSCGNIPD